MAFPPKPKWTEHYNTEAEFRAALSDIARWPAIQLLLDCTVASLRYWARKFGLHYTRGRRATQLSTVSNDQLKEMYYKSWSVLEMARAVGCDATSLRRRFASMGLPIPHWLWERHYSEDELRRLLSMFPVGWEQVIATCNVNRRTVYRWCKRLGISTPKIARE